MKLLSVAALVTVIVVASCKKKIQPSSVETLFETGVELHAIDVRSADSIVVAGGDRYLSGDIFATSDGGATWQNLDSPSTKAFYACRWVNPSRIVAGGLDGRYYESNDAGATWHFNQLNFWRIVRGIDARGGRTWLCGGNGLISGFASNDFGMPLPELVDTFLHEMRTVRFVDSVNLYAAGYGLIVRSSDLGDTWQPTSAEGDFFIGLAHANKIIYAAGMNGTVLQSENNGESWTRLKRGNDPTKLNTLWNAFDGNEHGLIIAGENGKINWYDFPDGKWYKVDVNTGDDISGVKLLDQTVYCCTRQGRVFRFALP